MAIPPNGFAHSQGNAPPHSATQPIDIEAWTEEATQSLAAISLSAAFVPRGTSVTLAIDLDEKPVQRHEEDGPSVYRSRREPMRRDSLKRREALLKGKEGSRRRTRWENGSYHNLSL